MLETAGGVGLPVQEAATLSPMQVLEALRTSIEGLPAAEVGTRRAAVGPNAVRSHHARALAVLVRQLRNALLMLLLVTAVASFFLGERTDSVIIGLILAVSVGLGFANEYRAERAAEALHSAVRHTVVAVRGGEPVEVEVTELVPVTWCVCSSVPWCRLTCG